MRVFVMKHTTKDKKQDKTRKKHQTEHPRVMNKTKTAALERSVVNPTGKEEGLNQFNQGLM